MIEVLEKIFGSAAKVKIMRLFVFNPTDIFDIDEVIERSQVTPAEARHEVAMMQKIGLLKRRSFFKDFSFGKGKKKHVERRRVSGFMVDDTFDYLQTLQELLIHISPLRNDELLKRLGRVGKLKLVIISGLFINNYDSRIDLLVVGDFLKKGTMENIIKAIEAEIGREIRYAYFETPDFQYRLGIYDKLIRDILDFQHEKILDKLNIPTQRR
jgi:hypothetical protein